MIESNSKTMKTGIELIAEERARQISGEGWTPKHDDRHKLGELSAAASCYADIASVMARGGTVEEISFMYTESIDAANPKWPWEAEWFKPAAHPIRNLVKAGALIAAEIEHIQRKG